MPNRTTHAKTPNSYARANWLPLLIGAVLCMLSAVLWWTLAEREQTLLYNKVKAEAEYLSDHIDADLHNRISSLQRMAKRLEIRRSVQKDEFINDANAYLSDMPGFQALGWIDRNSAVRWITPLKGNEQIQDLNLASEPKQHLAMKKAKSSRSPSLTSPIEVLPGQAEFQIYFPVYVRGELEGYILAILRTQNWLEHVISLGEHRQELEVFRISVFLDGIIIFKQPEMDNASVSRLNAVADTKFLDHRISIQIQPSKNYLEQNKTMLPGLTAMFGILLSVLVTVIVYLLQKASAESWAAKMAQDALEDEVYNHERTEQELQHVLSRLDLATKAGGIGVWSWDISTGNLSWNERMYELYGIPLDVTPTHDTWRSMVHPDDLPLIESHLKTALDGKTAFHAEFRIIRSAETRYLVAEARMERNPDGTPCRMTGITRDLTARKETESASKQSAEQVRLLLDSTAEAIYGIDLLGDCTFANQSCMKILGYTNIDQLLGRNMHNLIHHSYPGGHPMPVEVCRIYQAFREGKGTHVDDEVLWKADGTSFPAKYWSYPQIVDGQVIGSVVTFYDITERRAAEKALKESQLQFQELVETLHDMVWEIDPTGRYTYVSPQVKKTLGYEPHELLGKTPFDLMPPDEAQHISDEFAALIKKQKNIVSLENTNLHKDGYPVVLETSGRPFYDVDGKFKGYRGIDRNITTRKLAEIALKETSEYLDNLIGYANAPIIVWDAKFRITRFNRAFEHITGRNAGEVTGKHIELLFPEETKSHSLEYIRKTAFGEQWETLEIPIRHVDGTIRTLLWNSANIYGTDGKTLISTIAQGQDITERKRAEEEREKTIQDLQKALAEIKTLKGIVPICASCKKIRDDKGYWEQVDAYVSRHTDAQFTHGICPDCMKKLYSEFIEDS